MIKKLWPQRWRQVSFNILFIIRTGLWFFPYLSPNRHGHARSVMAGNYKAVLVTKLVMDDYALGVEYQTVLWYHPHKVFPFNLLNVLHVFFVSIFWSWYILLYSCNVLNLLSFQRISTMSAQLWICTVKICVCLLSVHWTITPWNILTILAAQEIRDCIALANESFSAFKTLMRIETTIVDLHVEYIHEALLIFCSHLKWIESIFTTLSWF